MGPNHNTQDPKLSIAFGLSLRADWGCCPRNRSISIYRVEELAHSRAAVTHLPAAPGWEHCNSWCHLEVSEESSKNHYPRPLLPLKTYTCKGQWTLKDPVASCHCFGSQRWKRNQGCGCPGSRTLPQLPLGFPVVCCLLAFSMACFLCSSVMEKPGGGAHMRPRPAFLNCPHASLEGFLVPHS